MCGFLCGVSGVVVVYGGLVYIVIRVVAGPKLCNVVDCSFSWRVAS